MSLGTLTITGAPLYVSGLSGVTQNFETVKLDPSGHVLDQLLEVQEELSDVGVDGRRWRLVNKQFRPFTMETTATFATYAGGIEAFRQYVKSIGKMGDLSVSLNASTYRWKYVKILDCKPNLYRANMVGSGITTSLAVIIADWSMVLARYEGNS